MEKTLCIFSKDSTTDFLTPIANLFKNKNENIDLLIIENFSFQSLLNDKISEAQSIFFLGHGCSSCLYGPGANKPIFDNSNINLLYNKKLFLLACRSNEFIENINIENIREYITFGNMLTDFDEVIAERNFDIGAFPEIDKEIIEKYRGLLVKVLVCSIESFINKNADYKYLYRKLKLLFTQESVKVMKNKHIELANLLYNTKLEMEFLKNI